MRTELTIRLDYGSVIPWVQRLDDETLLALGGPDGSPSRTPVDLEPKDMTHVARFVGARGRARPVRAHLVPVARAAPDAGRCRSCASRHRGLLARVDGRLRLPRRLPRGGAHARCSTLKALTYEPTGGIVAAPTTSLPEQIGGVRNWDYRYCWLRDATFTLYALMNAGFIDEARAWRDWLLRAVAGDPAKAQILYGVGGQRRIREYELDWLPGYEGSRPVRIGNAAHDQFQLDVYGEVMDALHQARAHGLARRRPRVVAAAQPDGLPRRRVGPARRGDLGGARPAPPLHALEGDGVGRVRPRRRHGRALRPAGAGRQVARRSGRRSTTRSAARRSTRSATRSCSRTAPTSSTRRRS